MVMNYSKEPSPSYGPKHRACDECRIRKLACSKDPGGCERCLSEGIVCVYSPQKRMGRPRKRRAAQDPRVADEDATNSSCQAVDRSSAEVAGVSKDGSPLAASLDLLPQIGDGTCLPYLDMLPNSFGDGDSCPTYSDGEPSYNYMFEPGNDALGTSAFSIDSSGADILQSIGFAEPELTSFSSSKSIECSFQQSTTSHISHSDESSPLTSSGTSRNTESPDPVLHQQFTNPTPLPNVSCPCLSSLYLALESLTQLPPDIPSAMRVARNTIKVAQDVLECPYCFIKDPALPEPVQAFQNLMCLGALIPSACNCYAAILEMVDRDTESAKKHDKGVLFSLRDIGGPWEDIFADQASHPGLKACNNKVLAPDVWRDMVRRILELDVYGLGGKTSESPPGTQQQRGLKDIVNQLANTTKMRHDMMDELVAAGKMPTHSKYFLHHHAPIPPEQRNCTRVIESARMALNSLVIS